MYVDYKKVIVGNYSINIGGVSEIGVDKNVNQDAFRIGAVEDMDLAYIIVADGLGSCKNSHIGAKSVVDMVENWLLSRLPEYSFLSDNVANILAKRLVNEWNTTYEDYNIYEYDTTVHLAVFYKGSLLIGGIGDGMAIISYDNIICKDNINAQNLFSNVTNSMCSFNVMELLDFEVIMQDAYSERAMMILSTDGIADDLIPDKKLTLPEYFREVLSIQGIEVLQQELKDWIEDWDTENHSDDKTICYLSIEKERQYE